ncbi:protein Smaug homolog 2-like isoform X2 [Babylonia areolata]|uniref:protein Smaug homolog 2-like isoform X2 n=1 Tax=Babylonia areolata TaxID=304850 RepID=UPI003FD25890
MKANSNFREQVGQVTVWFKEWSECEQTVALYSLLKKLTPPQAKFLDQVLQQSLAECTDVKRMQTQANDEAFIAGLFGEDKGKVIVQLLQLLPLLQAGNEKAKGEYLRLIPDVLSHTIENGVNIEESRQLLSYSLIHPAIGQDERSKLRMWLGYLEERFTYSISHTRPSPTSTTHDPLNPTPFPPISASPSQEGLNHLLGTAAASPGTAAGNGWHPQTHFPPPEGGAVSSGGLGEGGAGGSSVNGHQSLRASNSHAGAFSMHHPHPHPHNGHLPLHATSSAPPHFDTMAASIAHGSTQQQPPNMHTPLHRTISVAHGNPLPLRVQNPEKMVTDWLQTHPGGCVGVGRGKSPCVAEHAPLSPQSSVTSSGSGGSDSHHDDGPQPIRDSFLEEGSGMREVPVWLKTLRLHKYSYLFRQMAYEEMLSITEEWLEAQKVTKGARHKIVLSIQKLRGRQKVLCDFEKHIMEGGPIRDVLGEMKGMLNTPIKAYTPPPTSQNLSQLAPPQSPVTPETEIAEGNLPGQFVRLMGKVCTQLLTASTLDDDCLQLYFQLIDKCLQHEAFSFRQKSLLSSWKQQAQRIWQPPPNKYDRRQKSWGNTFPLHTVAARTSSSGSRSRLVMCQSGGVQQWSFGSRRSVLGASASSSSCNAHLPLSRNSSLTVTSGLGKPPLMESKQAVSRTQSAPLRSSQLSLSPSSIPPPPPPPPGSGSGSDQQATDTEINARLDSLCRSMTEHALGGDSGDKGSTF